MQAIGLLDIKTGRYLEVFETRILIVKCADNLCYIVVTTLQHITCRSFGVDDIIGVVGGIECIPVYLCRLAVARGPEVD